MGDRTTLQAQKGGKREKASGGTTVDAAAVRLARTVGNDEMLRQMQQGGAGRDAMLAHVLDRLRTMRTLQLREMDLLKRGAHYAWWREASEPHNDIGSPDPSRWKEAATLYERAGEQLCRGDLTRGRDLLQQAMEGEQRAMTTLTRLVDTKDVETDPAPGTFAELDEVGVCGPCPPPSELHLAQDIQKVSTEEPELAIERLPLKPWWTEEEEEEEEGEAPEEADVAPG